MIGHTLLDGGNVEQLLKISEKAFLSSNEICMSFQQLVVQRCISSNAMLFNSIPLALVPSILSSNFQLSLKQESRMGRPGGSSMYTSAEPVSILPQSSAYSDKYLHLIYCSIDSSLYLIPRMVLGNRECWWVMQLICASIKTKLFKRCMIYN